MMSEGRLLLMRLLPEAGLGLEALLAGGCVRAPPAERLARGGVCVRVWVRGWGYPRINRREAYWLVGG